MTLYHLFQGKRRRNRSNVEAMAAKHNNPNEHNEPELTNGRRRMGMMVMLRMMETPMRMMMIGWLMTERWLNVWSKAPQPCGVAI